MRAAIVLLLVALLAPLAWAAPEKFLDVQAQQSIPPRRFAPGVIDLALRHIPSPPAFEGANASVDNPASVTVANATVFATADGLEARFVNLTLDVHGGWNVFVAGKPVAAFQVTVSTPGVGVWAALGVILCVAALRKQD